MTAREKALEFAKNLPKPKPKTSKTDIISSSQSDNPYSNPQQFSQNSQYLNDDLNGIEEEPYDEYGNTLKETDLA